MATQRPARLDVGVVSAGRVGAVLAAALHAAGHRVVATSGLSDASLARARNLLPGVPVFTPDDVISRAELIILAVPDPVLADLVADLSHRRVWHAGQIVVHTSARHGIALLAPAASSHILPIAMHPAMHFTGSPLDLEQLPNACIAVTTTPVLRPVGEALAIEMGAEPVWVEEEDRGRYAAAVAHAVDHLDVLADQAAELLSMAHVSGGRRLLHTLMRTALRDGLRDERQREAAATLTELDSLRSTLATLRADAPDAAGVHLALTRAAAARAFAAGRLSGPEADCLLDLLATAPTCD